jgi:hypothetical protein
MSWIQDTDRAARASKEKDMAGGVLTNVVKGKMLSNADARLSHREGETIEEYRTRMQELLDWFMSPDPEVRKHVHHASTVASSGKDQLVATNEGERIHTRDEFFGDGDKAYFPDIPGDMEDDIIRGAYCQAIYLALNALKNSQKPKPIISYWIVTDGPTNLMECFVSETELEIHVLILTPRPVEHGKPPKDPNRSFLEKMFVVSTEARIAQIIARYPKVYADTRTTPVKATPGVQCLQVVGY